MTPGRVSVLANFVSDGLYRLPIAFVHVTEQCNSKCIGCEYWRRGEHALSVEEARALSRELDLLRTELVVLSGGEPLSHPRWQEVAEAFDRPFRSLWLLTSGLALARQADRVASICDKVTVSLDGADRESYRAIRGVDAFDEVVAGIAALVARERWVSLRTTVQRRNFREIPALIRLARTLEVEEISFFPADVSSKRAFARVEEDDPSGLALRTSELGELAKVLDEVEVTFASEIAKGLVAEGGLELRKIHAHFAALAGKGAFPARRCNAPRFSAVIGARGEVQPCHFIDGARGASLRESLERLRPTRRAIRSGARAECERCVCPMWKHPAALLRGALA